MLPIERSLLGATKNSTVTIGVRPEDLKVDPTGAGLPVTVEVVEEPRRRRVHLRLDPHRWGRQADHRPGRRPPSPQKGETVHLIPEVGHVHLFDKTSGERLGA
ncbi:hypothetical protein GCM10025868_28670 [Angustibacter aerolatus]|uniref:Transport-associated OB type 2 domain-containing protein n=1 Tax=Angustibacter aerolatus TaxID=1162965 RepID=A0ABQ6JL91_9ACTN|nr:hypothetical protein GCM10025868_28670 [Angustibacter aerolatus]